MGESNELNVSQYIHVDDVRRRCLFTGVDVPGKKRGEHVIPRWLVKDYALQDGGIQLGEPEALARILEFTAPADGVANQCFGLLEQRIKEDQENFSDDELYLWLLKLSSGMLWNHRRLAENAKHPQSPFQFDVRLEGIVSKEFQGAYAKWRNGSFSRNGSLTKLPSRVGSLMILHIFGATSLDFGHATREGIFPYVLMAVGRPGHPLLVASFFDAGRKWEENAVRSVWARNEAAITTEAPFVRAALAAALYTMELTPLVSSEEQGQRLMDDIAYAAGLRLFTGEKGVKFFRSR
ncbi:hypothetical protein [Luteimonas fraxinea]|uniref:HNH endonuclease n=1 Tax=Luteimonas fraxinea TaxID=2901869 RepID=A0ABS8UCR8_9GAMM|nr:hypothetical protein [Luteimonas fraxinea]MCD9096514.1 hypothetical protein [Luteimonas fraxinea]